MMKVSPNAVLHMYAIYARLTNQLHIYIKCIPTIPAQNSELIGECCCSFLLNSSMAIPQVHKAAVMNPMPESSFVSPPYRLS